MSHKRTHKSDRRRGDLSRSTSLRSHKSNGRSPQKSSSRSHKKSDRGGGASLLRSAGHSRCSLSRQSHRSGRSTGSEGDNGSRDTKSSARRRAKDKQRQKKSSRKRDRRKDGRRSMPMPHSPPSMAPVPKEVRRVMACVRGSEALPRDGIVSDVARRLVGRLEDLAAKAAVAAREENGGGNNERSSKCGSSQCVAILSPPSEPGEEEINGGGGGGGECKTTVAVLATLRSDVRTRYHRGIAWLNLGEYINGSTSYRESPGGEGAGTGGNDRGGGTPLPGFGSYSRALSERCRQLDVKPQTLQLSPGRTREGGARQHGEAADFPAAA